MALVSAEYAGCVRSEETTASARSSARRAILVTSGSAAAFERGDRFFCCAFGLGAGCFERAFLDALPARIMTKTWYHRFTSSTLSCVLLRCLTSCFYSFRIAARREIAIVSRLLFRSTWVKLLPLLKGCFKRSKSTPKVLNSIIYE